MGITNGATGKFGFAWVHSDAPMFRSVHSRSLELTQGGLGGMELSRIRFGSLLWD